LLGLRYEPVDERGQGAGAGIESAFDKAPALRGCLIGLIVFEIPSGDVLVVRRCKLDSHDEA
jgi:hypothetical protein